MNKLKSFLLGGSLILNSIWAFGYDFISGPLAYDIVSVKDKTAIPVQLVEEVEVLEIPYTVQYENIEFTIPELNWIGGEQIVNVKEVNIAEGIQVLGDAFQYYSSLQKASLSSTIIELGATFKDCKSLQSIVIPQSVEYISGGLFNGCTNLTDVIFEGQPVFSHEVAGMVYYTSNVFYNCTSLRTIKLPNNILGLGSSFFDGCTNLQEIYLPDSCISIGEYCFRNCSNLTTFHFPSNLQIIRRGSFMNSGLTGEIVIPNKVRTIEHWAFEGCKGIERFTFPNNCLLQATACFGGCDNLKSITIPNNGGTFANLDSPALEENISLNMFPPTNDSSSSLFSNSTYMNATLKIRKGASSYYSEDDDWGNFLHVEEVYEQLPITSLNYEFIVPAEYLSLLDIYYPVQYFEVMEGNSLPINLNYSSVGYPAWEDFKPYYNGASLGLESVIDITHIIAGIPDENHEYCTKVFITPPINSPAVFSLVYESAGVEELLDDSLDTNQPVEIFDFNGKRVLTDLHNLSSGLYIIKQGKIVKKIMIP